MKKKTETVKTRHQPIALGADRHTYFKHLQYCGFRYPTICKRGLRQKKINMFFSIYKWFKSFRSRFFVVNQAPSPNPKPNHIIINQIMLLTHNHGHTPRNLQHFVLIIAYNLTYLPIFVYGHYRAAARRMGFLFFSCQCRLCL